MLIFRSCALHDDFWNESSAIVTFIAAWIVVGIIMLIA